MWKLVNGRLEHSTDETRVYFRTSISRSIMKKLEIMARENNTHINYLLESGIKNLVRQSFIQYDKSLRPKDRIQYNTSYDEKLLKDIRSFAKTNNIFINDALECSVKYIDVESIKRADYRYRIEE